MCNFRVGDKVICVDDTNDDTVVIGEIYTISGMDEDVWPCEVCGLEGVGIELEETAFNNESCHCPHQFRPLAKRSDTLTIESFLTIKPGQYEEPRRRVVEPVKEVAK